VRKSAEGGTLCTGKLQRCDQDSAERTLPLDPETAPDDIRRKRRE
jgi:hypothetical protein